MQYRFTQTILHSPAQIKSYEDKVTFYLALRNMIGKASGDFVDLKAYEPDMRNMIDNYLTASDAVKIGQFKDLTLLDFVAEEGKPFTSNTDNDHKEGAAEAIENNVRRKIIERSIVNPRYYEKMSTILDKLIEERRQGVIDYEDLLKKYIKLAKDVDRPENAGKYPEKIRKSKALMAIYDNVGENEKLALEIHQTVLDNKMANFRDNPVVVRRIKKELAKLLNYIKEDRIYEEVERIYKVIEMQEEY